MSRSKSAGPGPVPTIASKSAVEELRGVCRRLAPYITRRWREVCEELEVADDILDDLEAQHKGHPKSELAFHGLVRWQEMAGRAARKEKILSAIQNQGLKRAEEEYHSMDKSVRKVPFMGRPEIAAAQQTVVNKSAKQKAFADRLSRPKTSPSSDQVPVPTITGKQTKSVTMTINPLVLTVTPAKPSDICEVKLKVTVKGIQYKDTDTIEQTRDGFKSTKDDYKHLCHTTVKLVIGHQSFHMRELRKLLDFQGISVQRLTKLGFNINVYLLCHQLGAFEILYQMYVTGRLTKIVHSALITKPYLERLNARSIELCVEMEEGLFNRFRDILILRNALDSVEGITSAHPVDLCDYFITDIDEERSDTGQSPDPDLITSFEVSSVISDMHGFIQTISKRVDDFSSSLKDLIITIRILKKGDNCQISCLQDLIDFLQFLRNSASVGQNGKTEVLEEYIRIVNQIRLKVQEIHEKAIFIAFDDSLNTEMCEAFHRALGDLDDMLKPLYPFKADDLRFVNANTQTGLEQDMFGGFLCFLPRLLHGLSALVNCLTNDVDHVSLPDAADDTFEGSDADKENVDKSKTENVKEMTTTLTGKMFHDTALFQTTASVNYVDTWAAI
ncbi:uncharacterized protein LOC127866044 [Dreissena polymorpha]|uniref:Death domain-containing protein n=1 Tax=Dreissena polymorpha TaxID=45954 RepID=A0A9D4RCK4_DREPO|nr:uncharacterized protein LOC127866044 [Dreissena polymorpha]XP_052262254.1 uncharacterized protein LOC127866044 [Dreissena polymorpha]XP_052262255.1 uncharacterized protein LOC127866044 [Dreissena polymorpha]XP_052262256.1 uncharacterized protein LOC127866044 [Dreissena polymorpha]KAH3861752.1 hypothetical protein DPMN_024687 [Dreissena polymorpha]